MRRIAFKLLPVLAASYALGCAAARNYPDPSGPRFAGSFAGQKPEPTVKVVSFNIKFSRRIIRAIQLFRESEALRDADIIALQEMDETGTERIARALSLNYVYYPTAVHPRNRRNFGNAILSRWPLEGDVKILLPHHQGFRKLQRIAVGATVRVGELSVRAYSVHLEAPGGISGAQRQAQVAAVLEDAGRGFTHVVVAGDFNNRGIVAESFEKAGFTWLTHGLGSTIRGFAWDHLFVKGLRLRDEASVGAVKDTRGASDHRPVWAVLIPEPVAAGALLPEAPPPLPGRVHDPVSQVHPPPDLVDLPACERGQHPGLPLPAPEQIPAVGLGLRALFLPLPGVAQDVASLEVRPVRRLLEDEVLGESLGVVAHMQAGDEDVGSAQARAGPRPKPWLLGALRQPEDAQLP